MSTTRELVIDYFRAWARQDRDAARAALADDLRFRAAPAQFDSADAFLDECWSLSAQLTAVDILREVADDTGVFLLLRWRTAGDSADFFSAEYAAVADGRIREILVVAAGEDLRAAATPDS
jgi:ketosteroid isomerase-like protein